MNSDRDSTIILEVGWRPVPGNLGDRLVIGDRQRARERASVDRGGVADRNVAYLVTRLKQRTGSPTGRSLRW